MLIAQLVIAVGLALLLVIGVWSTPRGAADVHGTLCLAAGTAAPAAATPAASDGTPSIDVLSSDLGICAIAVLCVIALVLLFRRLLGRGTRPLGSRTPRGTTPPRAGPVALIRALTLTELSISRT